MAPPKQTCSGCGAEIFWIKSLKNRAMPVDTRKVSIVTDAGAVVSGYTSHFATCPKASEFRKPKPAPAAAVVQR